MLYKKIQIRDINPKLLNSEGFLRTYVAEENENIYKRPFILILPGGGYEYCSECEGESVAFRFLAEGFNCAILNYSCKKTYPSPHLEVAAAMSFIRRHENELRIAKDFIAIIGFSAGGHLAASYSYLYEELSEKLGTKDNLKPSAVILSYPVLSTKEYAHPKTKEIITGNNEELVEKLDVLSNVDKDFPPTFIWTTLEDKDVMVDNTKIMIEKLKANKVKHDYKIFAYGYHGASIYTRGCRKKEEMVEAMMPIKSWPSLASDFIFHLFDSIE